MNHFAVKFDRRSRGRSSLSPLLVTQVSNFPLCASHKSITSETFLDGVIDTVVLNNATVDMVTAYNKIASYWYTTMIWHWHWDSLKSMQLKAPRQHHQQCPIPPLQVSFPETVDYGVR